MPRKAVKRWLTARQLKLRRNGTISQVIQVISREQLNQSNDAQVADAVGNESSAMWHHAKSQMCNELITTLRAMKKEKVYQLKEANNDTSNPH